MDNKSRPGGAGGAGGATGVGGGAPLAPFTPFTPTAFTPSFAPLPFTPATAAGPNSPFIPATNTGAAAGFGVSTGAGFGTSTGVGTAGGAPNGAAPFRPLPFTPFVPFAPTAGAGVGGTAPSASTAAPAPFVPFNPSQFQPFRPSATATSGVAPAPLSSQAVAFSLPTPTPAPAPAPNQSPFAPFQPPQPANSFLPTQPVGGSGITNVTAPQPTASAKPLPRGAALASSAAAALTTVDLSAPPPVMGGAAPSQYAPVTPVVGSASPLVGVSLNGSPNHSRGGSSYPPAINAMGIPSTQADDPTSAFTTEHFSCHSLPNSKDTAAGVGLPFGVLLTPSVTLASTPAQISAALNDRMTTRRPIECNGCGSVLNPYCVISRSDKSGKTQWKCVMCRTINEMDAAVDGSGSAGAAGGADYSIESGLKVVDYLLSSPPAGFRPTPAVPSYGAADTKDLKSAPGGDAASGGSKSGSIWNASTVADVEKVVGHSMPDTIYPDCYVFVIDTNLTKQTVQVCVVLYCVGGWAMIRHAVTHSSCGGFAFCLLLGFTSYNESSDQTPARRFNDWFNHCFQFNRCI